MTVIVIDIVIEDHCSCASTPSLKQAAHGEAMVMVAPLQMIAAARSALCSGAAEKRGRPRPISSCVTSSSKVEGGSAQARTDSHFSRI
jgi:hypothetical protein